MNPAHRRATTIFFVVITTFITPPLTHAGSDHDRARSALMSGEIMPLKALLERLETDYPGQVLEVELDRERGRWVYEVKVLQSNGRLLRLDVDASSGAVLKERRRESKDRR
jgi:uncharacterized membrane protein YkoI